MLVKQACILFHKLIAYNSVKFSQSTSYSSISINPNDKAIKPIIHLNSQISKHGRTGNIKDAETIFNRMPIKNVVSWTAMLTAYAENGQINNARKLFDEMPERNVASWNAMITGYMRSKNGVEKACELFSMSPEKNAVSYASMITGYVRAGRLDDAHKLFCSMPVKWRDPFCSNALMNGYLKRGKLEEAVRIYEGMVEKNVVSWSCMVDGYCKLGETRKARELFDTIPERNVVTWTAMIDGYIKTACFEEGFALFLQMRGETEVKLVSNTLTVVFEGCGRLDRYREALQIHALVMRMGFELDTFLGNSVITMYCRLRDLDSAVRLFNIMEVKDTVSWNALIGGYVQAENIDEAYKHFNAMPHKDVYSWTTMITGFSNKGLTEKSVELFDIMPYKDDITWTALISGFASNGEYEDSIHRFIQMLQTSVKPNALTFSSVLSSSASLAALNQGLQIHTHVVKTGMEFDLSVQNSLVSFYAKCGCVDDAYTVFNSLDIPNAVSYNSMINGFAQNGYGIEALDLFKKMEESDVEPNDITFLGVLSACTHVGLVAEGRKYFKSMRSLYKIEPSLDHYACMVDLLGRAGLLDEAYDFINSMPFEPHSGVWGALLGASRTYFRLDLAEIAAQRIYELEPENPTPYVVLSDIYMVCRRKENEELVRTMKRSRGLKKSPGCSWIMVQDDVNLFLSGDRSHRNFEEIKSTLWLLVDEM
ncbi:putative tetratricopeptide-like helical domain superfamily [Helianthus annuus]|nr:putative tetratricopeptide-like helical domain superfamily [Helianthus annuus]KAJ0880470.1 putative tetratricopeptide-like helical domain superfamily [Helianthus annuus]KAJ0884554.1 putative tetratricopeptide-like helical domain superfamily [Helianthus annuus]